MEKLQDLAPASSKRETNTQTLHCNHAQISFYLFARRLPLARLTTWLLVLLKLLIVSGIGPERLIDVELTFNVRNENGHVHQLGRSPLGLQQLNHLPAAALVSTGKHPRIVGHSGQQRVQRDDLRVDGFDLSQQLGYVQLVRWVLGGGRRELGGAGGTGRIHVPIAHVKLVQVNVGRVDVRQAARPCDRLLLRLSLIAIR